MSEDNDIIELSLLIEATKASCKESSPDSWHIAEDLIRHGYRRIRPLSSGVAEDVSIYGQSIEKDGKRIDPKEFYKSSGVGGGSELSKEQKLKIMALQNFAKKASETLKDVPPEIVKLVDENFWDLVEVTPSPLLPLDLREVTHCLADAYIAGLTESVSDHCRRMSQAIVAKFGRPALEPLDSARVFNLITGHPDLPNLKFSYRRKIADIILEKFGTRPAVTEEELRKIIAGRYNCNCEHCYGRQEEIIKAILVAIGAK